MTQIKTQTQTQTRAKKSDSTLILIDDRAGSAPFASIPPLCDCSVLCHLDSADAMITGNGPDDSTVLVGVEIKSIPDLLSSMQSGRIRVRKA